MCRQSEESIVELRKVLMDLNSIHFLFFKCQKMPHAEIKTYLDELKAAWMCMTDNDTLNVCLFYILWLLFLLLLNECGLIRNFLYPHDDSIVRTMERHNLAAIKFVGIKAVFPQWHLPNHYFVAYFSRLSARASSTCIISSSEGQWNPF